MKLMTGKKKTLAFISVVTLCMLSYAILNLVSFIRHKDDDLLDLSLQVHEYYWVSREVNIVGQGTTLEDRLIVDLTVVNHSGQTVWLEPWYVEDRTEKRFKEDTAPFSEVLSEEENLSFIHAILAPSEEVRGKAVFIISKERLPVQIYCNGYSITAELP